MSNNKSWPKIRQRGKGWQVDLGKIFGKRIMRSFPTRAEAEGFAQQMKVERENEGTAALSLTMERRREAAKAIKLLPPGTSLVEVARFYVEHAVPHAGQVTVCELLYEYLEAKKQANRRRRTIEDIRSRVGRFAATHGQQHVHTITNAVVQKWINTQNLKPLNKSNYSRALSSFFGFAIKRGYISRNPVSGVEKITIDEKIPGVLTAKEVETLMRTTERIAPKMVLYFALATFAGIRPAEIQGLDWKNIDFDTRVIRIVPTTAKKRRMRLVDMSDNLVQWLLPHKRDTGKIHFLRSEWRQAKDGSGVHWEIDILRHTYASMHLAQHEQAERTSLQMGHRGTDVLFSNYRNLVTREDANKFWQIVPSEEGKIIRIEREMGR